MGGEECGREGAVSRTLQMGKEGRPDHSSLELQRGRVGTTAYFQRIYEEKYAGK